MVSKTLMLLTIAFCGTMAGLGDKIYKLCKEVHEWYTKVHVELEQNALSVG